jgi:hypothetical protein
VSISTEIAVRTAALRLRAQDGRLEYNQAPTFHSRMIGNAEQRSGETRSDILKAALIVDRALQYAGLISRGRTDVEAPSLSGI